MPSTMRHITFSTLPDCVQHSDGQQAAPGSRLWVPSAPFYAGPIRAFSG